MFSARGGAVQEPKGQTGVQTLARPARKHPCGSRREFGGGADNCVSSNALRVAVGGISSVL
jgi:hypothetical protein